MTIIVSVKGEDLRYAGDIRSKDLRQVSTAVGDGALPAMMAEKYLETEALPAMA